MIQETDLVETEYKKLRREWAGQVFSASYGKRRWVNVNPSFFKNIANVDVNNTKSMIIVEGDFNTVLVGRLDRLPIEHPVIKI